MESEAGSFDRGSFGMQGLGLGLFGQKFHNKSVPRPWHSWHSMGVSMSHGPMASWIMT